MSNTSTSSSNGIGFAGLLTIVFITLKLLGKITWSWWWVLSPIWITACAVIGIIIIVLIVGFIVFVIKEIRRDKIRG